MDHLTEPLLIVGLGNPGPAYENTRHNIGNACVRSFAKEKGCVLSLKKDFLGECGQVVVGGRRVVVLLPVTFMNLSGQAVKRCVDFYKIKSESIMVVSDDVALPLGKIRVRPKGSCGGHNGLRDIEKMLQTMNYGRLKIGVGLDTTMELSEFVVGRFKDEERKEISGVFEKVNQILTVWIEQGYQPAIERVGLLQNSKKGKQSLKALDEKKLNED